MTLWLLCQSHLNRVIKVLHFIMRLIIGSHFVNSHFWQQVSLYDSFCMLKMTYVNLAHPSSTLTGIIDNRGGKRDVHTLYMIGSY